MQRPRQRRFCRLGFLPGARRMTVAEVRMSLRTRRRVGVLLLSAALHALLLGALALRLAPVGPPVGAASADVSFVAAPALVRWARAAPVPRAPETPSRAIVSAAAPRYVDPPQAATGPGAQRALRPPRSDAAGRRLPPPTAAHRACHRSAAGFKPAPMTKAPLAAYPALRMRRLRQADWIRRLTRETVLTPADLIWSMVVHEGEGQVPVGSMPGISRLSVKECAAAAKEAEALGIPAIAVFPHIDGAKKDARGSLAADPNGLVARAVKAMKDAAPEVGVLCDVALDPFTDHGHDGLIEGGRILNDATIEVLVAQGLMQAEAGCDILAPSDMMDGRCGALRRALEAAGKTDVMIMSYAAKYASAFYGPYREAIGSGKLGTGSV